MSYILIFSDNIERWEQEFPLLAWSMTTGHSIDYLSGRGNNTIITNKCNILERFTALTVSTCRNTSHRPGDD